MATGIVITPDNRISEQEFPEPIYDTVGKVVGGWVEVVRPDGLAQPFCMCVDEAGLLREKLEFNLVGSILYGTGVHGHPIVGAVVLMKEEGDGEKRHLAGLSPEEARAVRNVADFIIKVATARKRGRGNENAKCGESCNGIQIIKPLSGASDQTAAGAE